MKIDETDKATVKEMLYKLLARLFKERVNEMFMRDMIYSTPHLSIGQEGIAVSTIYVTSKVDLIISNHRGNLNTFQEVLVISLARV